LPPREYRIDDFRVREYGMNDGEFYAQKKTLLIGRGALEEAL
jgi:hypothetical protein